VVEPLPRLWTLIRLPIGFSPSYMLPKPVYKTIIVEKIFWLPESLIQENKSLFSK